MILVFTQLIEFDLEKEKRRIAGIEPDSIRKRQEKILNLFVDGKYSECYKEMAKLPYDSKKECDELEYVNVIIFETIQQLMQTPNAKLEKIKD